MTLRLVIATVAVTVIAMALQVPEAAVSAYIIFFVTKKEPHVTFLTGCLLTIGVTAGLLSSAVLFRYTLDQPALRLPATAAIIFAGMYISRVFVLGPLGFAIGFVIAVTQSSTESFPTAELLIRTLLWFWVIIVFPIAVTVMVDRLSVRTLAPRRGPAREKKPVFAGDALTNPVYVQFGLKVALAAMSCYVLYTALDWPGIHTAFITCIFIALESNEATLHKALLRLSGCLAGGFLGFLAILYLVPHMESIVSLVLLIAAVSALAGWVASGSERISYAGLQMAFAFFMCLFQGFAPATGLDTIRDRIVGILLGIIVISVVFYYLWPEPAAPPPKPSSHPPPKP